MNETLHPNCHSHISRVQKTAKTCFQNLKVHLEVNDYNANCAMSVSCFECFKQFICNFLHDDCYTLIVREMFIRISAVVCLGIFLIKTLSDTKTNDMLAFAFSLSFVFGFDVSHCILTYF